MTPRSCNTSSAAIVAGRTRSRASCHSPGTVGVEPVDRHDHGLVLGDGVPAEGQGRVGRRPDDVGHAGEFEHVRHVPAAAPLDVVGVHGPAVDDVEGVGERQVLVQPVGVQAHLDVVLVGDPQRGVEGAACAPKSSCTLNAQTPASRRLEQRLRTRGGAAPEEAHVHRPRVERAVGRPQAPAAVDARPPERAELLPQQRGDAAGERGLADPRRQQVDVRVDGTGSRDHALAGDDDRRGADDDVHAVDVSGLPARPMALTRPSRTPMLRHACPEHGVEEQHVGDHDVAGLAGGHRPQPDAVARGLAEAGHQPQPSAGSAGSSAPGRRARCPPAPPGRPAPGRPRARAWRRGHVPARARRALGTQVPEGARPRREPRRALPARRAGRRRAPRSPRRRGRRRTAPAGRRPRRRGRSGRSPPRGSPDGGRSRRPGRSAAAG